MVRSNNQLIGRVKTIKSTEVDRVDNNGATLETVTPKENIIFSYSRVNNEKTLESIVTKENFAFSHHVDSELEPQNDTSYEKTSEISNALDKCINASTNNENFSIASLLRAQKPAKRTKYEQKAPIAFIRLNTMRGTPKPILVKALLDSGGSGTLIHKRLTAKLHAEANRHPVEWKTAAGNFTSTKECKISFTIPELYDDRRIDWRAHIVPDLGKYDVILGRDMLEVH